MEKITLSEHRIQSAGQSAGFTLVELAIVLVVIGLIVAGILTGQDLIAQARLRSVTGEIQQYTASISNFRGKYLARPGDFDNAFSFWGADCAAAAATCNGDGDGQIERTSGANEFEWLRAWQHLSLAEMIPDSVTGVIGTGIQAGVNVPESAISRNNAGYQVYFNNAASPFNAAYGRTGTVIHLAGGAEAAAVSSYEAWSIDDKIDDSEPESGNIRTRVATGPTLVNCINGTTDNIAPADYQVQNEDPNCQMYFFID